MSLKRLLTAGLTIGIIFTSLVSGQAANATATFVEGSDAAAEFFNPLKVSNITLVHSSGYPALTMDYLNSDSFRHADITITLQGQSPVTFRNVGVRLKGQASRYDSKFPMKVKFDAFVSGQKFLGLKRLTLNNMVQDGSYMHEVAAYKIFRTAGVPAPRTSFAKVSVDGHYFGLYLNLESIDTVFGNRWFNSVGHVYSGPYNCDIVPNNTCYTASIGDSDRTDLNNAASIDGLSGAAWWNALKTVSDRTAVVMLMGTDIYINNWDGYTDAVQNNHSVVFTKTGEFSIVPWGLDQTFQDIGADNLTWDNSKPNFRGWGNHRSTMWDHCIAYDPCHDELLRDSGKVALSISQIDLANYISQIGNVINPIIQNAGDIHPDSISNLHSNQSAIINFLATRTQAFKDFLTDRPMDFALVKVSGKNNVGQTLRADLTSAWDPNVTVAYQWQLDGANISGQTNSWITLTPAMFGHRIGLTAIASKSGQSDQSAVAVTRDVNLGKLSLTPTPSILGTLTSGKTLTLANVTWESGVTKTYVWLRDGKSISGATKSTYKLTPKDRGHQISVTVNGTKTGYEVVSKTSAKSAKVR